MRLNPLPRLLVPVLLLLGCLAVAGGFVHRTSPASVSAEERGVTVTLDYKRGYSNWGPTDVYGSAVLWPHEGVATLGVHYLPRLPRGEQYVWWVANTATNRVMRLGVFNTTEAGDALQDTFLTTPLPPGANAVLVTVVHPGEALVEPGPRRTLMGYFSAQTVQRSRASTVSPQPVTSAYPSAWRYRYVHKLKLPVAVVLLPRTGGAPQNRAAVHHSSAR